jgi:hypothetical protein
MTDDHFEMAEGFLSVATLRANAALSHKIKVLIRPALRPT